MVESDSSIEDLHSLCTCVLSVAVFLRGLGFVYFIAFLCLVNDGLPLLGSQGLLPAEVFVERLHQHFGSAKAANAELPSIFILSFRWENIDLS